MMQGNACYLGVSIVNSAGAAVEPVDVQDVEIALGRNKSNNTNNQ